MTFAFLPEPEDPDSFVRAHGTAAFERLLAQAMPLSEFMLKELVITSYSIHYTKLYEYPLVVPCHRVIAAHGGLGGFARQGGGFLLDVKRWLLAHEQGR